MSSGTPFDSSAAKNVIDRVAANGSPMGDAKKRKLSKRQKRLNRLWSYFRVEEYLSRKHDWTGDRVIDRDAINHGPDQIPPGFEDAGGSMVPMRDRRPTSPLGLVRTIVTRFTGLLFSNKRNPHIAITGDEHTEYYVTELIKAGRFWPTMVRCRNYGGSMGSACIGFKFIDGDVVFEAFDPRWCFPQFLDADKRLLSSIEVRYTYPKEVQDEDGNWTDKLYWYRRVINENIDRIWVDVPDEGGEPAWDNIASEGQEHNLGFVPAEWGQNLTVDSDIDGDPDCQGCYDMVEAIDSLIAQAHYGVQANNDPTLVISTPDEVPEIRKGSDNAIKLTTGTASYLEMDGQGTKVAQEMAKMLEERVYRLAACVPEAVMFAQGGEKTATEIERAVGTMLEKADMLREQYGTMVVRILNKLIRAVRHLTQPMRDPATGDVTRGSINLPPRPRTSVVEGQTITTYEAPTLGPGRHVTLRWGRYYPPTLNDIETAIRAFTTARDSTAMDDDTMLRILAPYYGDEIDWRQIKEAMAAKVEADAQAEIDAEPQGDPEPPAPTNINIQALINSAVTFNEYRESLGLGPIPNGDKTVDQLKAEHPEFYTAAAMAGSKQAVDAMMADVQHMAAPEDEPGLAGVAHEQPQGDYS
jgi:hypothetical protein